MNNLSVAGRIMGKVYRWFRQDINRFDDRIPATIKILNDQTDIDKDYSLS